MCFLLSLDTFPLAMEMNVQVALLSFVVVVATTNRRCRYSSLVIRCVLQTHQTYLYISFASSFGTLVSSSTLVDGK